MKNEKIYAIKSRWGYMFPFMDVTLYILSCCM